MSGPKHLWSGDWQRDSERAADERGTLAPLPEPEPEPEPQQPAVAGRQTGIPRRALIYSAIIAAAVALGAGIGLAVALGGSSHRPAAKAQRQYTVQTAPPTGGPSGGAPLQPAPVTTGPTADWEGMQIVTSPAGAVVSTVRLGSPADRAGFQPGDVFDSIGGRQINSVQDIRTATAAVRIGGGVRVELSRGSSLITVGFPLRQRPTIQP